MNNSTGGITFVKVPLQKSAELAKEEVENMDGSGVFSTAYYLYLITNITQRIMRQGVPIINKRF